MFKRPHTSKTSTPLRSSDLRRLRDELTRLAPSSCPPSLAKQLLPDGTQTLRVTTHLGELCTVYAVGGNPIFFRLGTKDADTLVPTCYAFDLWPEGCEKLFPNLVTAREVVEHLVSGSALFGKGISNRSLEALPATLKEGDLVTITAEDDPRIVAVGQLTTSAKELLADRKGKAVLTLHARDDFLWKSGTEETLAPLVPKSSTTEVPAPEEELSDPTTEEVGSIADTLASTTLADPTPVQSEEPALSPATATSLTPSEVDTILRTSLLLAIQTSLSKNAATLLPLPASSLYSNYVLPFRPAHNGTLADIKKSSFKNLSQFLKVASKAGVLVTKEVKGDLIVFSVNATHPDVLAVRPYKTLAQSPASTSSNADSASNPTSSNSSSRSTAVVKELLKPPSSFLPLIESASSPRPSSDLYSPPDLKKLLIDYVTSHSLNHPRDQKFIKLDEALQELLLKKEENLDVMSKEEASRRLKDACVDWYEVWIGGKEVVCKKGAAPVIKVALKTVGKRMVTLISGFESWSTLLNFTALELSEELKHLAASSSTVQPLASSSPKKPLFEIMVQGSQEKLVLQLLEKKGVPRGCVVVDSSKVKK